MQPLHYSDFQSEAGFEPALKLATLPTELSLFQGGGIEPPTSKVEKRLTEKKHTVSGTMESYRNSHQVLSCNLPRALPWPISGEKIFMLYKLFSIF